MVSGNASESASEEDAGSIDEPGFRVDQQRTPLRPAPTCRQTDRFDTARPREIISILFPDQGAPSVEALTPASPVLADLNLDQVIASATTRLGTYDLGPLYRSPLGDLSSVQYRQQVFVDLENGPVSELLSSFAVLRIVEQFIYRVRDLADDDGGYNHYHRERHFLNAAIQYCDAVKNLTAGLCTDRIKSSALSRLRDYLVKYVNSKAFEQLDTEAQIVHRALGQVRYCVLIKGDRVTVGPYTGEDDYGEQVRATFARFQQGAAKECLPGFEDQDTFAGAGIVDLVAQLFPETFGLLDDFCARHRDYLDDTVNTLDRELQFYLSYLRYIKPLRAAGLSFCLPALSSSSKVEQVFDTFDIALAAQLCAQGEAVVCNNVTLSGVERILVVSGPNNGGKTTFARAFGQLHYLARLGCPVPGREGHLFLCDHIFTHFETEENAASAAGKLQDELNRMKEDFDRATSSSLFIMNEVFNSTSADDALFLSREILRRVCALDALGVCVTFLDELAHLNEKVVSMVSTVAPEDPAIRTHQVVRRPADGHAYAQAIADKYGLTYDHLVAEIRR